MYAEAGAGAMLAEASFASAMPALNAGGRGTKPVREFGTGASLDVGMTGLGGVGGVTFLGPVIMLLETGSVTRFEEEEGEEEKREDGAEEEEEEEEESGWVGGGDCTTNASSDVCPGRHVGDVLCSPKLEAGPILSQASFVNALKRAADSSSSKFG